MSFAGNKKKNNKSKKPYLILALSSLVVFVWLEGVMGTPYQAFFSPPPNAKVQALSEFCSVLDTPPLPAKNVLDDYIHAGSQGGKSLFPEKPASAFAYSGLSENDFPSESSFAMAAPEPPSMLLFASAMIGLASIGRKRLFKR